MLLLFNTLIVAVTIDAVHSQGYKYRPELNGWIKVHKVVLTWDEAEKMCKYEGAEMASPINLNMLKEMQALMVVNEVPHIYHIGLSVRHHPDFFVTLKGISIDDMPVSHMIHYLEPRNHRCLVMNQKEIWGTVYTARLPFICFKERQENQELTECGTFDADYHYIRSLGECYKFHDVMMIWEDCYFACQAEGGYLATDFVNHAPTQIINEKLWHTSAMEFAFIGLKYQEEKNETRWLSIYGDKLTRSLLTDNNIRTGKCGAYGRKLNRLYAVACDERLTCLCAMNPNITRFPPPVTNDVGGAKF